MKKNLLARGIEKIGKPEVPEFVQKYMEKKGK